jgi:NitT/TauT family transport system substrate-binding protein
MSWTRPPVLGRLVLALSALICTLTWSAAPARAEDVVRLGNLKFAHYGAVSYMTQLGAKCGIKVEERFFAKGTDVMQALISGELDIGATGSEAAIAGRANGVPVYIVGGFATGGARLLARPDAGVKKVADLKGKKVGVTRGGIQDLLLIAELAQAGLTYADKPGKDVLITYLVYPDLNQALLTKQLDAIMQTEPQSSQAIAKGFGVEVIKPYNTPIGSPVRTLLMTEKMYKERRPIAEKLMTCFVMSTKMFMDDPKLASRYVRETLFKGQVSEAEFDAAIGNSPYSYDITAQHIQTTADLMDKYGIGKFKKKPVATDFVKTDLLEKAKKALGIK